MTKEDELNFYGEWSIFVAELIESRGPTHPFPGMRTRLIREALATGNLRGIKMVPKDLVQSARAYSKLLQKELDAIVQEKFGVGLSDGMKKEHVAIGVIIARGALVGDEERQLLEARAQQIEEVPARSGELQAIRRLLNVPQRSTAPTDGTGN